MKTTGWLKGLRVISGGTGIVSHAGVALLRALADRTGLTGGLSRVLASPRVLVGDRGRVLADLACAIADGAEVISDFRVMSDQKELFGPVASVPTCWRTLNEIATGGEQVTARLAGAVNTARRGAWAGIEARHGALPARRGGRQDTGGGELSAAGRHRRGLSFGQGRRRAQLQGIRPAPVGLLV